MNPSLAHRPALAAPGAPPAAGPTISILRAALPDAVATLGLLVGVLVPNPTYPEKLDINADWFASPLDQTRAIFKENGEQLSELIRQLLGEIGGSALDIPIQDAALLGIWSPISLPGSGKPSGLYFVSYEKDGNEVFGLGILYRVSVSVGSQLAEAGALVGPSQLDVEVWGLAPLVQVGSGDFSRVLGTEGFPLSLGIALVSPDGPIIDAAGFSFAGVKTTASIDVAAANPVDVSTLILQLQLPGEKAPQDRSLAELANVSGDELLSTAASLAIAALGSVTGAEATLQYLAPVLGLNPNVPGSEIPLPLLGWASFLQRALAGGNLGEPFITWFTALIADGDALQAWLTSLSSLVGVSSPAVTGGGTREEPYSAPLIQSGTLGTLALTLASTVDEAGTRRLYPGLSYTAPGVALGTSAAVLQLQGVLELAELELAPGGTVSYAGPSSLNGAARLLLVNKESTQPLFQGQIDQLQYRFGALRGGVELASNLQLIPHFELVDVQTPTGKYDVLDLTQPGDLVQTALQELVQAIVTELESLLGLGGDSNAFGSHVAALIGFTAPSLPESVEWPSTLAPPLSASQLVNTLQNPATALGSYYANLLQGTVGGQPPIFYLVNELAGLLQEGTGAIAVNGSGTGADPWRVALSSASLPVSLVVFSEDAPGDAELLRLTFGLDFAPPVTLPGGPGLVLNLQLQGVSLDLPKANVLSPVAGALVPGASVALELPQGFTTPPVLGAAVQVSNAALSLSWSRATGLHGSVFAGGPALVVGGTTLAVGENLDFDETTSLQELVTQQAKTFAPILTGLLGVAVARTGSPAGLAVTGLLGLLPNLTPFMPQGLTWPTTLPALKLDGFDNPIGALRTQVAGLFSSNDNARAALTLLAWALQAPGGAVPVLDGSGTYADPFGIPLGFTSAIGGRVWYNAAEQMLGVGLGRAATVSLGQGVQMTTDVRLDMIEVPLGSQTLTDQNPVPSLSLLAHFSLETGEPLGQREGVASVDGLELGVRFALASDGSLTLIPIVDLVGSQTADRDPRPRFPLDELPSAASEDQEGYLVQLNLAIQSIVSAAKAGSTFQTVYDLLGTLGLALVRTGESDPYGVDPAGWMGLLANPLAYLSARATTVLEDAALRTAFYGVLQDLLGLPALNIPPPLLDVFAAMDYVAPRELGYAPRPDALVALGRHPVQTLVGRFVQLVTSPEALVGLIGTLTRYQSIPSTFGLFALSIVEGRVIQLDLAASRPFAVGNLAQLSGALLFDLRQLTVGASARLYFPAIGASLAPAVEFSAADGKADAASPALTLALAWGDGSVPSAPPLPIYPFDASAFIQNLAALAPVQALSTFVTQVADTQLLARYPLAQVTFSALGLAFQDAGGAWHLKSFVGLLEDPLGWFLSDSVLGSSGLLNPAQLAKVLKAIPSVSSSNGVSVSQTASGVQVAGLPFGLHVDVGVDLPTQLTTFSCGLDAPVSLAGSGASLDTLALGLSLGTNFQPGVTGTVSVSGDVGLSNRVFASLGYGGGFTLAVGEQGSGSPVLQLLPFQGWTSLVTQAASVAIQTLLQTLTSVLLKGLAQVGAGDFATRLSAAGTALDVADLVSALSKIVDPQQMIAGALAWLTARVSPTKVQQTMTAIGSLFEGLVSGVSAQDGLITYQPGSDLPLTLLVGTSTVGGVQQLGLWAKLSLPAVSLLQIGIDQTGVGVDLSKPSQPLFSFGVHLSVPIAGETGPELDFVYNSGAQQFQLAFDPQGGGSELARELYPNLFGSTSTASLAQQVEQWLLQILVQVLPRYVSLVVLNTSTVLQWLDAPIVPDGPVPGAVLVASQVLVKTASGYALNSFEALSKLTVQSFLAGFLQALLSTQVKVLSFGKDGGIWLEPNPQDPSSYGVRVAAPDLGIPGVKNIVLQLGATDANWIQQAGGPTANPGLSVYVPIKDDAPSFKDLALNLVNVGIDVQGANQDPLLDLSRFRLGAVSPRALLSVDFAGGSPTVQFGGAVGLDEIGISVAPTQLTDSSNAVAQNLLGSGEGSSDPSDTEPTNPAFSVRAGYVEKLYVELIGPTGGSVEQVLIPVHRSFGPLNVDQVGVGWEDKDKLLQLLFDGGVRLAGLSAQVQGLTVGIPVTTPTDYTKYTLDLAGLNVGFSGGSVAIGGGLLKAKDPLRYDGAAVIKAASFSITAFGSYALVKVDPDNPDSATAPSLFIFAALNAPLGGVPEFFVTGLAGGFSYNRGLIIPEPGEIQDYPLVQAAMNPQAFFGGDSSPGNALAKLSTIVYPEVGSYWVGAGLKFTTYELLEAFVLLLVKFGREFEVDLVGAAVLSMPPMVDESVALAYIEMGLVVAFKPDDGVVSIFAQLTPNSFVLDRNARLTGGFAFFLWYAGPHGGDFVVTMGGYHPAFDKPSYYPDVPRLGLNWPISTGSPDIGISGDAYFALTPSSVMAGAHLALVFEAGPLRAWFNAGADFLISWLPFYFDAEIHISVGVSVKVELFGVSKTLSASLGAALHMFGPPTGGIVEVDWYVVSFSIPFGATENQASNTPLQSWSDFAGVLLPAAAGGSGGALAAAGGLASDGAAQQVVKLQVAEGLLQDDSDGWLVKPLGFRLRADTVIPATTLSVTGGPAFNGPAIGVRPMDVPSITTPLEVSLEQQDTDGTWQPVPLPSSAVTITQATKAVPEALWAQTFFDADAAPSADVIPNAVVGVEIAGDLMQNLDPIGPIPLPQAFEFDQAPPLPLPYGPSPYPPSPQLPQTHPFQTLASTLMSPTVVATRNAVFQSLLDRDVAARLDPSLDVLAAWAGEILVAPPVLARIGVELAPATTAGIRVRAFAAASPEEAPTPVPLREPQLLGGIRRYRVESRNRSTDGLLLPWTHGVRGRWLDERDGNGAQRSLLSLAPVPAAGAPERRSTLFPGSTTVWAVDPVASTAVQSSGGIRLRVSAFDRAHQLLEDRRIEANDSCVLPEGTEHVALTGLDDRAQDAAVVGWQSDTPVLKVNHRYLLADGCVIHPQSALRLRRDGRRLRRGVLDCAEVLAANRVQNGRGAVSPGWIETLLPGPTRSVVVLAAKGEAPAVSVVAKATPGEPVRHVSLEPRAVRATGAGQLLFFDVPASAGGGRYLSVRVRPATAEQLRGVFGTPASHAHAAEQWGEHSLRPLGVDARAGRASPAVVTLVSRAC